jgi:hypothetical protein
MSLFTEKYEPKNISQIVGHKKILPDIFNWIHSPTTKLCLIEGPIGIGKSLCVKLICNQLKIQPYYVDNSQENININILKSFNHMNRITNKKNYIIIEEIDTISTQNIEDIVKNINNINVPIICISNTNYIPPIKSISNMITNFKMFAPYENEILEFLYPILRENKISLTQNNLKNIISNCNNDIRYILNTIEMMMYDSNINKNSINTKDHTLMNMFEISKGLFDMDKSIDEKFDLFSLEYSIMPLFIQENYINNTINSKKIEKKMENISNSSMCLSHSDIFENKMYTENDWELAKYISVCNIESTTEKCNTKIIKFPEYFKKHKKQFSSYENSLKNINYYYPIDSQIDKISVEQKKIKTKSKKTTNTANPSNPVNTDEPNKIDGEKSSKPKPKTKPKTTKLTQQPPQTQQTQQTQQPPQTQQTQPINDTDDDELILTVEYINKTEVKEPKKTKNKIILKPIIIEEDIKMEENLFTCECGIVIKKTSKSAHLKSKKHIEFISKLEKK